MPKISLDLSSAKPLKGTPIHCKDLAPSARAKYEETRETYWLSARRFLLSAHGKLPAELSSKQIKWLGSIRQELTPIGGDLEDTPFNS